MYISKISIKNFRNFKDNEILFNEGTNVIIGHNNAGKSNLLKALSLILNSNYNKRLDLYDFNQHIDIETLKANPPKISISITISESEKEDDYSEDLVTVANFLTKIEKPYEATLTYEFFLPEKEIDRYKKAVESISDKEKIWEILKKNFIRLYVYRIWGGNPTLQNQADSESLQKFDFQFLDAIRDVERDMFSGKNTMLKDVLDFYLDYNIKKDNTKTDEEKSNLISNNNKSFATQSSIIIQALKNRLEDGEKEILNYAQETGASFNNAKPTFNGELSENEILTALKLIIKDEANIKIPATHNGLGYNNLIFMSLLLSKMQIDSDGEYLGSNAKIFPILAIEEPEAHLHPCMQYKFLKFLKENKKARQIFITTHSTQITSAVDLDNIICLYNSGEELSVGYPSRVFQNNAEDLKSKAYIKRFLDATKSNMLFAKNIIFVEGITEELLLPTIAKYIGKDIDFEGQHTAIINVNGKYFSHFIKLFDRSRKYHLPKKVACITDKDPTRKEKPSELNYKKCYPFEYNTDENRYLYKCNNPPKTSENIQFFLSDDKGKTFEYDLIYNNSNSPNLITECMSNINELKQLMKENDFKECCNILKINNENNKIKESLSASTWTDTDKRSALIASRYLNSISKGENALELCEILEKNIIEENNKFNFNVPNYIKKAIEWISE